MMDFEQARANMVDCQVRTCDVTEHSLISAMLTVAREEFVPEHKKSLAYIDEDISLAALSGEGRYLMQAASFAKLAQLAAVEKDDVVLVVGAGSGYSSAILSLLASSIVAIESNKALAEYASNKLTELGYVNIAVLNADLEAGYEKEAPYNVIFFNGAIDLLPEAFFNQMANNGRLVCVEGEGNAALAKLYFKQDDIVSERQVMNCAIKSLPGFVGAEEFCF